MVESARVEVLTGIRAKLEIKSFVPGSLIRTAAEPLMHVVMHAIEIWE